MIYICDFKDSFTFNIFAEVKDLFPQEEIVVIKFHDIKEKLSFIYENESKAVIILGPGPGHPQEYNFLHKPLKKMIGDPRFFFMGICLGHQILCSLLGAEIKSCTSPIHGQKVRYDLSEDVSCCGIDFPIYVQRYNSLAVELNKKIVKIFKQKNIEFFSFQDEIIITSGDSLITYQFHPESVGTTCPKSFFRVMAKFLL